MIDYKESQIVRMLLDKFGGKDTILTRRNLHGLRILGIDEVGIADKLGSIHVGFYIHTSKRQLSFKDSKRMSRGDVRKSASLMSGFKMVRTIPPSKIYDTKKLISYIGHEILNGIRGVNSNLFDLVVIDGDLPYNFSAMAFHKPIITVPKADTIFSSVKGASIIAKNSQLEEFECIADFYRKEFKIQVDSFSDVVQKSLTTLYGPTSYHKIYVYLNRVRNIEKAPVKDRLNILCTEIWGRIKEGKFSTSDKLWVFIRRVLNKMLDKLKSDGLILEYKELIFYSRKCRVFISLKYKDATGYWNTFKKTIRIGVLRDEDIGKYYGHESSCGTPHGEFEPIPESGRSSTVSPIKNVG